MQKNRLKSLARNACIAAVYAGLCLALQPISYGALNVRVSEALTLLPAVIPGSVAGVTVGCFLANLVGCFTGANILGALDVVFGTLATLAAALCTRRLAQVRTKGLPLAAALPPVLFNGLIVGAELTWAIMGQWSWGVFAAQALFVALGEAAACVLGVFLVRLVEKDSHLKRALTE